MTHRRLTLEINGTRIGFRGVDDAHLGRDKYSLVAGPVDHQAEGDVVIGVTHAPYRTVIDAMTYDGCDLVVAGHTHGGQVCVPLYGALVTNCDLDSARVKGLSINRAGAGPRSCTSQPGSARHRTLPSGSPVGRRRP